MLKRAQQLHAEMVRLRRDIHAHPELGFQEVRTAALVADTLHEIGGISVRTQVGKTGVVGEIGTGDGPTIGIRADMDALPILEESGTAFASTQAGVMHACGHDAHTAILLGVAHLLKQEAANGNIKGKVRFLFQPAEEVGGDGVSGAPEMIKDGALAGVDHVIALHVASGMPVGKVGLVAGSNFAAGDIFQGNVLAAGGHGAMPHAGSDAVMMAMQVVQALNAIVSRNVDPMLPAVCSIGRIHGGSAFNVIPAVVEISGTLRSYDPAVRELLFAQVERAFALTRALGGDYELSLVRGYPAGYNDPTVTQWMDEVASELVGATNIDRATRIMGSEDFTFMQQLAPGTMMMLGAAVGDMERPHHTPVFDIDETAMPIGAAILAETVVRYFQRASAKGIQQ
jgi:amidohydrolase